MNPVDVLTRRAVVSVKSKRNAADPLSVSDVGGLYHLEGLASLAGPCPGKAREFSVLMTNVAVAANLQAECDRLNIQIIRLAF